jgi:hypothetical protein
MPSPLTRLDFIDQRFRGRPVDETHEDLVEDHVIQHDQPAAGAPVASPRPVT